MKLRILRGIAIQILVSFSLHNQKQNAVMTSKSMLGMSEFLYGTCK